MLKNSAEGISLQGHHLGTYLIFIEELDASFSLLTFRPIIPVTKKNIIQGTHRSVNPDLQQQQPAGTFDTYGHIALPDKPS